MKVFDNVNIGDTISFRIFPNTVVGESFNYCSIKAVLDYDTVSNFIDIDALHANVYPSLPNGVPNNPCEYSYLKILQPSGQHNYIGLPWVDKSSIVVHGESNIRFSIENVIAEDISKINALLSANGYNAKDWTIE